MDTNMVIEMVGYFASLLVLVSFLMSSVIKLRIVNSVGSFIFAVYAVIIHSYPTALMNFCLVGINLYYLRKLLKSTRQYAVTTEEPGNASLQYFLNYYKEDILKFFPDYGSGKKEVDAAYVVWHNAVPAGVTLGQEHKDGSFEIAVDYTTPQYRDCSVGKYLYAQMAAQGISNLSFPDAPGGHVDYLRKMGFVEENGVYRKKL